MSVFHEKVERIKREIDDEKTQHATNLEDAQHRLNLAVGEVEKIENLWRDSEQYCTVVSALKLAREYVAKLEASLPGITTPVTTDLRKIDVALALLGITP